MIARPEYLNQLISWQDKDVIKVITGVRRCGKSTLLDFFHQHLRTTGIRDEQVTRLDMEDLANQELLSARPLHAYVTSQWRPGTHHYLLIDEVQMITDWQRAIISLYRQGNIDIYLTGSNAYLLSGELATLLSGRYLQIQMQPLSLSELAASRPRPTDPQGLYRRYIRDGGFPFVTKLGDEREVRDYLKDLYHTIIIRDIIERYQIRDVAALERVAMFLLDNIGNLTNISNIVGIMTADGQKTSPTSIDRYVTALQEAYIFYRADRYDIKGKQYLKTNSKYYVSDLGWRYHLRGAKLEDTGSVLENAVYLELRRRGGDVFVGKVGEKEVDFVVNNGNELAYYQVSQTVRDNDTKKRELSALQDINDSYPKYLLTLDDDPEYNYDGIKQLNALTWLLQR